MAFRNIAPILGWTKIANDVKLVDKVFIDSVIHNK